MPSFVVHGLVPLLVVLALRLAPPRVALATLPFAWLPDLDFWVGVHRATFSNVFVLLPTLYLWYCWRETEPDRARYAAIGTFYLASHLLMDVFAGGIVAFWPLWDKTFFWHFLIQVNTETGEPDVTNEPGTSEGAPEVVEVFTWLTPSEAAMLAFTIVAVGGTMAWRWYKRRGQLREIEVERIGDE